MKKRVMLVGVALLGLLSAGPMLVEAGWVWTPHTGWIGPSGAVKDTPPEQLAYAGSFFQRKEYDKAKIEFKKLEEKQPENIYVKNYLNQIRGAEEAALRQREDMLKKK